MLAHINWQKELKNTLVPLSIGQHICKLKDQLLYYLSILELIGMFLYSYQQTILRYNFLHIFDFVDQNNNLVMQCIWGYRTMLYCLNRQKQQCLLDSQLSIFVNSQNSQLGTAWRTYCLYLLHMFLLDIFLNSSMLSYQHKMELEFQDTDRCIIWQFNLCIAFQYKF